MTLIALTLCSLLAAQDKPAKPPENAPAAAPAVPQEPFFKTMVKQVSLDGQFRLRYEYRDPLAYTNTPASTKTDDFFLERLRINLKFTVTDDIEVFAQPQDQRTWGQEPSVVADTKNLDIHQAYAEFRNLFGEPLSVKAGRMELSYGDQRLISPLDWSNVARSWDGAKIRYAPADWWVEAFYTLINEGVGAAEHNEFFGVYGSYIGVIDHEFDLYALGRLLRTNTAVDEQGLAGDQHDLTVGARIKGKAGGLDYSLEAMEQSGAINNNRISAYAYAATLGYSFDLPWAPRLGVEYTYASGDNTPNNDVHNTFDPLFPFGHYYQGYADVFSFKNGKDAAVYLKVVPTAGVSVHADFHTFWLASDQDGWYNAGGVQIRRDVTGAATSRVGEELDLHARIAAGKFVKFWAGWSHVFAGPYIDQTPGQKKDMDWFFLQMTVDF